MPYLCHAVSNSITEYKWPVSSHSFQIGFSYKSLYVCTCLTMSVHVIGTHPFVLGKY